MWNPGLFAVKVQFETADMNANEFTVHACCACMWISTGGGFLGVIEPFQALSQTKSGGSCEIRTHGGLASSAVFKTAAFNRSAKLPEIEFYPQDRPCLSLKWKKVWLNCLQHAFAFDKSNNSCQTSLCSKVGYDKSLWSFILMRCRQNDDRDLNGLASFWVCLVETIFLANIPVEFNRCIARRNCRQSQCARTHI